MSKWLGKLCKKRKEEVGDYENIFFLFEQVGMGRQERHEPSREEAASTDPMTLPVLGDLMVIIVGGWVREEAKEPFM
jgi:hypothetical protein